MPRTIAQAKIMQPTGNFHHHVADTILPVADFVLHDSAPLHPTNGMLDPHFLARNAAVFFFLFQCEFTTAWFLRRLPNRYAHDSKSLKPHILIEHAVGWQHILFVVYNRFLMPFSRARPAHILHRTSFINQQNILDSMIPLLPTIILPLFIGIYWSLDGTFRSIMVKRGALSDGKISGSGIIVA